MFLPAITSIRPRLIVFVRDVFVTAQNLGLNVVQGCSKLYSVAWSFIVMAEQNVVNKKSKEKKRFI